MEVLDAALKYGNLEKYQEDNIRNLKRQMVRILNMPGDEAVNQILTYMGYQDYLKKMRKDMPCSAVVNFPYDNVNGYYQYPENIRSDMEEFMIQAVSEYVDKDRIFMWK